MRIAIVHDWLDTWRGGENVLAEIVRIYPEAELFALVDFLPDSARERLSNKRATTSFLQRLPGARRYFRTLLPLFPGAIESLDVGAFDLVISSSHAVAKGVRTRPGQLHICYCHTPMRYAWDLRDQYLRPLGLATGLRGALAGRMLDRLREWDRRVSDRVTHFVANSRYIASRIERCYGRVSTVIYPPVDVDYFTPGATEPVDRKVYVAASRWVPYKRMDLIAAAFRNMPDRRLVLVGDGPEAARVRSAAGSNVEFVGELTRERLRDALRGARAFVFAADEDFGILPVEAQACGTPVIAYGRGGSLETVRGAGGGGGAPTGAFFDAQTAEAIAAAVRDFDAALPSIRSDACRANAARFSAERFRAEFAAFVESAQSAPRRQAR